MPTQFDIIVQHDERITKLEETHADTKADIAVLQSQVADGFEMLAAKLDKINTISERVTVLETRQQSAAKGLKWVMGIVAGLIIVAVKFLVFGAP